MSLFWFVLFTLSLFGMVSSVFCLFLEFGCASKPKKCHFSGIITVHVRGFFKGLSFWLFTRGLFGDAWFSFQDAKDQKVRR